MPARRPYYWNHSLSVSAADLMEPFKPSDVPGLELWLDAEAITGLSDGAAVATWPDSSGNGRNVTQATGSLQPLWKQSIANGRPAVRFDGVDDVLAAASATIVSAAPLTSFVVATPIDINAQGVFWSNSRLMHHHGGGDGSEAGFTLQGVASYLSGAGFWANGVTRISTVSYDAALALGHLRTGRYLSATTTGAPAVSAEAIRVGFRNGGVANEHVKADIHDILIFNRLLTPWERFNVERYLSTKYGLTLTPHVPTDVTGLKLWVRAESLALSDGARIAQWNDESGQGNHLTQATQALQPTYWSKASTGLPAVRCDGVDDFMTAAFTLAPPFTLAGIINPLSPVPPAVEAQAFLAAGGNTPDWPTFRRLEPDTLVYYDGLNPPNKLGLTQDAPHLVYLNADATVGNAYLALDGSLGAAGSILGRTWNSVRMGARDPASGFPEYGNVDHTEWLIIDHSLSAKERLTVEDYLRRRILV